MILQVFLKTRVPIVSIVVLFGAPVQDPENGIGLTKNGATMETTGSWRVCFTNRIEYRYGGTRRECCIELVRPVGINGWVLC